MGAADQEDGAVVADRFAEADAGSLAAQRRELPDHPGLIAAHIAALARLRRPLPPELEIRALRRSLAANPDGEVLRRLQALTLAMPAADLPKVQPPVLGGPPIVLPEIAPQADLHRRAAAGTPIRLRDPVHSNCAFVFVMPKTGSGAVIASLEAVGVEAVQCHRLSEASLGFIRETHREILQAGMPGGIDIAVQMLEYENFRAALADPDYARLTKVVTTVREPLARTLSAYFHEFGAYVPFVEQDYGRVEPATVVEHVRALARQFVELPDLSLPGLLRLRGSMRSDAFRFASRTRMAAFWFEEELRPVFGIDVFSYPVRAPCLIGNIAILKTETLDTEGASLLGSFVRRDLRMLRERVGADRPEGEIYKEVTGLQPFPAEFVRAIHGSRYARHFYSPEELDAAARHFTAIDEPQPSPAPLDSPARAAQ